MEGRTMSKTNLSALAKSVAAKNHLSVAEVERFIQQMFEVANDGLQTDKQLKMRWLGTFKITSVKDRESVDVNTGERILIEGREKITFTPDNVLKDIVNKPFAQFETVVVNDGVDFSDIDEKFAHLEQQETMAKETVEQQLKVEPVHEVKPEQADEPKDEVCDEQPKVEATPDVIVISDEVTAPKTEIDSAADVLVVDGTADSEGEEKEEVLSSATEEPTIEVSATVETPVAEVPVAEPVKAESTTEEEPVEEEPMGEDSDEEVMTVDKRHFVIPRYWVAIACFVFVALMGGMCWFAFNYGKMQAQRDHLAMQLNHLQTKKPQPVPVATSQPKAVDSTQIILKEKAKQDSIRLAEEKVEQKVTKPVAAESGKYDNDPRVRTGAYRIVGIDRTVVVKEGQTLASISKQLLGPGMECYVEAVNAGVSDVKVGQKIKVPKLELKKRSK